MTEIADIKDILREIGFHSLKEESDGWRTNRAYCNGDNMTALKIFKTGFWYDFVDNRRGTIKELVKLMLGHKDISETEKWFSEHKIDLKQKEEQIKPKISEPKKFEPSTLQNLLPVHDYWLNRGISLETLLKFKGGLCTKTCKMKDRYVFPIFNGKEEIIGFCARDVTNKSEMKYKIVGSKNNFIWPAFINYEYIKKCKSVILVESPGCVLKMWESGIKNVICLFGTEISFAVINFLLKVNIDKIIIATNNEESGIGNRAAEKIQKKLNRFFDASQIIIKLPIKKDFGEMSTNEIKEWNVF